MTEGGRTGGAGSYHCCGSGAAGFSAVVRVLPDRGIACVAFANAAAAFSSDGTENEALALPDTIIAEFNDDPDVQRIVDASADGAS